MGFLLCVGESGDIESACAGQAGGRGSGLERRGQGHCRLLWGPAHERHEHFRHRSHSKRLPLHHHPRHAQREATHKSIATLPEHDILLIL